MYAIRSYYVIGIALGAVAGYYGGWVDSLIMRFVDIMLCFPTFFLILAVIAFLEPVITSYSIHYTKLYELIQAIASDPDSAFLRYAQAQLYIHLGDDSGAIRAAEDTLLIDPQNMDALILLGSLHFAKGNNKEAIVYLQKVVTSDGALSCAFNECPDVIGKSGWYRG